MKTTKQQQNKVELFIRRLRKLNEQGLIKLMEEGSRPDLIEVEGEEVLRGKYKAIGYYEFEK